MSHLPGIHKIGSLLRRLFTTPRSLAAFVITPMVTAIGTVLTSAGVLFCQSLRRDETTDQLAQWTLYGVFAVFLVAAPLFALLTLAFVTLHLLRLVKQALIGVIRGQRARPAPTPARGHERDGIIDLRRRRDAS